MDSIDSLKEFINKTKALLNYSGLLNIDKKEIFEFGKKIQEIEINLTKLVEE